jgi:nucleoid-associated protein YgaU
MAGPLLGMIDPRKMFTLPQSLGGVPSTQQRAKIVTVDADGKTLPVSDKRRVELEFQFNPAELEITKSVTWKTPEKLVPARNAPDLDFGGGKPASFSLSLIFDTTQSSGQKDVRTYTQELLKLVMLQGPLDQRLPPPRVQFQWGGFMLFMAVVEQVKISYILFLPDGTPVRAKATVSFIQQDDSDDFLRGQNPTTRTEARKTRIVRTGDRLDLVAYQEYGDSSYWRHLAEANGILDPLALQPGQVLALPPLP